MGRGRRRDLGLDGEVVADDLHAMWAGEDPSGGERLGRFPGRQVAGFDLTFRAPKSVSLLAGLGDPDTAKVVRDAHEAAVDAAFGYVEREAARSRTGKGGVNQIEVNGLVAAAFRHRTSRAGDPHLHTHVLVANMAEGADGVWRTLDGRWLYLYAKTAGYLYEAHLRHELTGRLGVEWGPVKNGIADIDGIDEQVRDHFSDRAKEIQEHLDEVGFRSARAAEIATLDTRKAKDTNLDRRRRCGTCGRPRPPRSAGTPTTLADAVHRGPEPGPGCRRRRPRRGAAELGGPDQAGVVVRPTRPAPGALPAPPGRRHRGRGRGDGRRGPCPARGRAPRREPTARGCWRSNVIRRADGKIVAATGMADARWSTAELIGIERHVVDRATARTGRSHLASCPPT